MIRLLTLLRLGSACFLLLLMQQANAMILPYYDYDFLPSSAYTVATEGTTLHTLKVTYSSRTTGGSVPIPVLSTGSVLRMRIYMPPGADTITISGESGDWQGVSDGSGSFAVGTYPVMGGSEENIPFCSDNPSATNATPCGSGTYIYPNQLEAATGGLNKKVFGSVIPNPIQTEQYFYFIIYQQPNALGGFEFDSLSISMTIADVALYNNWWYETNGGVNPSTPTDNNTSNSGSLSLTITPATGGSIRTSDAQINCSTSNNTCSSSYTTGTTITLSAVATTGYQFTRWTGGCSGSTVTPISLTLTSDMACSAVFSVTTTVVDPEPEEEEEVVEEEEEVVETPANESSLSVNPIELRLGDQTATPATNVGLVFYGNIIRDAASETLDIDTVNTLEADDIINLSIKITPNPAHSLIDLIVVSSWGDQSNPMRQVYEKVEAQDFFGFSSLGWSQWDSITPERLTGLKAYKSSLAVDDGQSYLIDIGHGQLTAPSGLEAQDRTVAFYVGYRYLNRLTGNTYLVINETPLLIQLPDAPAPSVINVGQTTCAYGASDASCDFVRTCEVDAEAEAFLVVNRTDLGADKVLCSLYGAAAGDATLYITTTQGVELSYLIQVVDPNADSTTTE